MKKTVIKKRLKLKENVKEWLAIHAFGLMFYVAIFAWLFDSRKWGLIFACGFMALFIALEILVKIFKKVSKNLLTKLAK
jgi:hypothetical protein